MLNLKTNLNMSHKYSNTESEAQSLTQADEEMEVPIVTTHYPSLMEDSSKKMSTCLKVCLAFIIIFLMLTIFLCFVYASKGHPGFYWLGIGLTFLASISGLKLHWMQSMDWDSKVKWSTIAQGATVIFLCMGLMAVMYGPRLKAQVSCSANTEGYYIGGFITGLDYPGLLLGTNAVQISAGASSFTLGTPYPVGSTYTISVIQQPYQNDPNKPVQYCRVTNPSGTIAPANVTSIAIRCE